MGGDASQRQAGPVVPRLPAVRRTLRLAYGGVLLGATGCYTYAPIRVDQALELEGERVRLVVTQNGTSDLEGLVDPDAAAPSVRGTVAGEDGGSLLLRVPIRREGVADIEQVARIPIGEIMSTEHQLFSTSRTALLAAGGAGAAAFVLFTIIGGDDGNGPDPSDPGNFLTWIRLPVG